MGYFINEQQKKIKQKIIDLGDSYGFKCIDEQDNIRMLAFCNLETGVKKIRLNIYWGKLVYGTITVATIMNHPNIGKNQLFRKVNTISQLEEIFDNPRVHTGNGYRLRSTVVRKKIIQKIKPKVKRKNVFKSFKPYKPKSYVWPLMPQI